MDVAEWMLSHGENAQVMGFFSLFLLFAVLERVAPRRSVPADTDVRWRANVALTLLSIAALGAVPVSFLAAATWAEARGVGLLHAVPLPAWALIAATLLLRGLISTATHWLNHKVPWLWRIHRVHHLDTDLDVSSTVRFHPLEMVIGPVVGVPVVVAFGLTPWVLVLYELLDVGVTLFSHSNLRLPLAVDRYLRYLIVTPDLHRIHHSSWQPETDSNYSAVFPIWDIVLGTFRGQARHPHESMELGLPELRGAGAHRIGGLLLSPFRKALEEDTPVLSPPDVA